MVRRSAVRMATPFFHLRPLEAAQGHDLFSTNLTAATRSAGATSPSTTTSVATTPKTAELHVDDLHRVVESLGVGPVDAFGSSAAAVCQLALLEARRCHHAGS